MLGNLYNTSQQILTTTIAGMFYSRLTKITLSQLRYLKKSTQDQIPSKYQNMNADPPDSKVEVERLLLFPYWQMVGAALWSQAA